MKLLQPPSVLARSPISRLARCLTIRYRLCRSHACINSSREIGRRYIPLWLGDSCICPEISCSGLNGILLCDSSLAASDWRVIAHNAGAQMWFQQHIVFLQRATSDALFRTMDSESQAATMAWCGPTSFMHQLKLFWETERNIGEISSRYRETLSQETYPKQYTPFFVTSTSTSLISIFRAAFGGCWVVERVTSPRDAPLSLSSFLTDARQDVCLASVLLSGRDLFTTKSHSVHKRLTLSRQTSAIGLRVAWPCLSLLSRFSAIFYLILIL